MRASALITMLLGAALTASAATPNEFYASLLRRGIAAYDAHRYEDAARSLRLAAFGFVEVVDQYQTAHVYLALTHERLGSEDRARDSARRIVAAQRIDSRFMGLALPQPVRTAFEALAARLLTAPEVQMLRRPSTNATATNTTTTTAPPVATAAQPPRATPTQPGTTPATTQPSTTTTTTRPATTTPPATTTTPQTTTTQPPVTTTRPATTPQPPVTTPPATTTQPRPSTTQPPATTARPQPQPQPATPPRTTTTAPRPLTASEVASRLNAAERALTASNLDEARRLYRELLNGSLERASIVRVAEGLYRARDFSGALSAFQRLGTLQRGEEPYRYYVAVALYETGQYERAKRELAAALPFIEITPDVARYRTRIEGALP
jgi:hypothetical protein